MSNEKDANDPPTEDPDKPEQNGSEGDNSAGNGTDTPGDGAPASDDRGSESGAPADPPSAPASDPEPVDSDDDGAGPTEDSDEFADDGDSDEVWDDGVVIDDAPSPDDAGESHGEPNGDAPEGVTEPIDDGEIDELGSSVEVEGAEIADDPDEDDLLGGLRIDSTFSNALITAVATVIDAESPSTPC